MQCTCCCLFRYDRDRQCGDVSVFPCYQQPSQGLLTLPHLHPFTDITQAHTQDRVLYQHEREMQPNTALLGHPAPAKAHFISSQLKHGEEERARGGTYDFSVFQPKNSCVQQVEVATLQQEVPSCICFFNNISTNDCTNLQQQHMTIKNKSRHSWSSLCRDPYQPVPPPLAWRLSLHIGRCRPSHKHDPNSTHTVAFGFCFVVCLVYSGFWPLCPSSTLPRGCADQKSLFLKSSLQWVSILEIKRGLISKIVISKTNRNAIRFS